MNRIKDFAFKTIFHSLTLLTILFGLSACNSGSSGNTTTTPPTITSFSINGVPGVITSYEGNPETTDYNITVQLPESTILTSLVPVFSVSSNAASVSVNNTEAYSGSSANDFNHPLIYTVNGTTAGSTTTYTVAVNYGVVTTNITESIYYSLSNGLSIDVQVYLDKAYEANGQTFKTQQIYQYGDEQFVGSPAYKLIQLGMARDNPSQPPIGTPVKLVVGAAILLFLPSIIGNGGQPDDHYYYPPLFYNIPVVP